MIVSIQCHLCKHFEFEGEKEGEYICPAFREGIPEEILFAWFDHRNEYPNDNGIRFEAMIPYFDEGQKRLIVNNPNGPHPKSVCSQCELCKHYKGDQLVPEVDAKFEVEVCDAFPNGIPPKILLNRIDHSEPFVGDKHYPDDSGIRFEPITPEDIEWHRKTIEHGRIEYQKHLESNERIDRELAKAQKLQEEKPDV
jgi:hypothetical protein